jgi:hypothetical protein
MSELTSINDAIVRAKEELPTLPENLRVWAERHLVAPREITLWCDPERTKSTNVWLLTDHIGDKDASSRIVFDPEAKLFGLEMTLEDGTEWYMGPHTESFAEMVRRL